MTTTTLVPAPTVACPACSAERELDRIPGTNVFRAARIYVCLECSHVFDPAPQVA